MKLAHAGDCSCWAEWLGFSITTGSSILSGLQQASQPLPATPPPVSGCVYPSLVWSGLVVCTPPVPGLVVCSWHPTLMGEPCSSPAGPLHQPGPAGRHLRSLPGLPGPGPVQRPAGGQGGYTLGGWRVALAAAAWVLCHAIMCYMCSSVCSCFCMQIQQHDWRCTACGADRDIGIIESQLVALLQQVSIHCYACWPAKGIQDGRSTASCSFRKPFPP